VSIVFLPHAKFLNKLSQFKIPSWVEIPKTDTFQDILVESDLLVTDFSSNSFEMAYMDKPSVIYIPGANDLNASLNHYHLEHLDYVHMSYCKTKEQAVSKI
jgi:CDP-glycerol glycerophosphotransferase (TagB/SpsB family)